MTQRKLSPNMLWLCLDQSNYDNIIQGTFHTVMDRESVSFYDVNQMILKIDEYFDHVQYPQSFQQKRSFKESTAATTEFAQQRKQPVRKDDDIIIQKGAIFTGVLMVMTRQHANWQGSLLDCDFNKLFEFRDIVELINKLTALIE